MKTLESMRPNPELRGFEENLAADTAKLFRRYPGLAGFSIAPWSVTSDDIDPSGQRRLFIEALEFVPGTPGCSHEEVCELIGYLLEELVGQWPQARELLRGRTFSSALH
ncbi:MAG TPA: hypothetical protein VMK05_14965 [Burkholderiales bacterium]|nr:hypothetical protein [Burkholderiales bacterium]